MYILKKCQLATLSGVGGGIPHSRWWRHQVLWNLNTNRMTSFQSLFFRRTKKNNKECMNISSFMNAIKQDSTLTNQTVHAVCIVSQIAPGCAVVAPLGPWDQCPIVRGCLSGTGRCLRSSLFCSPRSLVYLAADVHMCDPRNSRLSFIQRKLIFVWLGQCASSKLSPQLTQPFLISMHYREWA